MCGRFVIARERDDLAELFEIENIEVPSSIVSYNIAPTQAVPIVVVLEEVLEWMRRGDTKKASE